MRVDLTRLSITPLRWFLPTRQGFVAGDLSRRCRKLALTLALETKAAHTGSVISSTPAL